MTRAHALRLPVATAAVALALSPLAAETKAPETIDPKASCVTATCHPDVKKAKELHGPVADDDCTPCHVPKDNRHEFTYPAEGRKLCETCHDPFEAAKAVHEPVKQDCLTCHEPHGAASRGLLTMDLVDLCAACHDGQVSRTKSSHAHKNALEGKACLTCHAPHTSAVPKLLTQKPYDLCLSCHDKPVAVGDRIIPSIKAEIADRKVVHGPVEDEECEACHEPHGSPYVAMVRQEYPASFYAPFGPKTYALCFSCHDEGLLAKAETDADTEFRNGTRNLHAVHVDKAKGRTCRACHAVHAASQPALIRDAVPFGRAGWSIRIRFTKTDTGGACATACHVPRAYDRKQPVQY